MTMQNGSKVELRFQIKQITLELQRTSTKLTNACAEIENQGELISSLKMSINNHLHDEGELRKNNYKLIKRIKSLLIMNRQLIELFEEE